MKFSEQWLREWVNPEAGLDELVEQLTMAGLEVDGVELAAGEFSNVVVGEIVSVEPHPDAEKLRICQVANDAEPLQVVCGAPNAAPGLKVPFAKIGAKLPGDFKIKKAKLRGVESNGMLCGASELGMIDTVDGLMELPLDAPTGMDVIEYLQLNDTIVELDLTPNRGDCLGLAGLAREVGVLNKLAINEPDISDIPAVIDDVFNVSVNAHKDCPRYVGRVIRDIDVTASTPLWMREKLRRSDIRSIDPVVDVTNYVMLELGQPMHAFDLDQLKDGIVVRHAQPNEKLTLLDGQELELKPDSLLIADASRALALAGIMGGEASGVSTQTNNIFLESAFFSPTLIAGRARSYGLHTDSSHRFERGVDFKLQRVAIERATALLLDIVGGKPGPVTEIEATAELPNQAPIELRRYRIEQVLGMLISDAEVDDILTRLGFGVSATDEGWVIQVPSYRFDISIEADLMEELARIYGYNKLPVSTAQDGIYLAPIKEAKVGLPAMRRLLVARGFHEAINYSFIEPELQALINPDLEPVKLANPISADMGVMRTSLWPGLLNAMRYNLNRQQPRVRLFESGLRFIPQADNALAQQRCLAGLITGARQPESWAADSEPVDFFDLKSDVEAILELSAVVGTYKFEAAKHSALHPGQTARVSIDEQEIGWIGALHPTVAQQLDISGRVYLFELSLQAIEMGNVPNFKELSKFPEVRRDLAIIINKDISSSKILGCVRQNAGENLVNLVIFDEYQGEGIDFQSKSLAIGLTFQNQSRTLNESEVNEPIDAVIDSLRTQLNASLRN